MYTKKSFLLPALDSIFTSLIVNTNCLVVLTNSLYSFIFSVSIKNIKTKRKEFPNLPRDNLYYIIENTTTYFLQSKSLLLSRIEHRNDQ